MHHLPLWMFYGLNHKLILLPLQFSLHTFVSAESLDRGLCGHQQTFTYHLHPAIQPQSPSPSVEETLRRRNLPVKGRTNQLK